MSKKKGTPSTVLLKSIVTYLTDEVQRPSKIKDMTYTDLVKFLDETEMLKALKTNENTQLRTKTLAFAFKMVLMFLGEKIEVIVYKEMLLVYKGSIKVYELNSEMIDMDNPKNVNFDLICHAGLVLNTLKGINLSDTVTTVEQTALVI